jgi:hypothetical protein
MPDANVQAAISNWTPRFMAQGVDYNDYFQTTARVAGNCTPWNFGECWPHLPALTRAAFQCHSNAANEAEAITRTGQISLDGVAQRIKQPLLVIHGKADRLKEKLDLIS